ncbi:hypothetical protein [Nocardia sp. NPDC051570]|uniref:hypothetical protein n=1 Tax=Nocardia sp. NPDC051570 TaxID=3364324 RepID=UPI0037A20FC3
MVQREISLKKDETLLVKWMPEPFRYARLARADAKTYVFDLYPDLDFQGKTYSQLEIVFFPEYYQPYLVNGDSKRECRIFGRSVWGRKTVKQLLIEELANTYYDPGYEIVDWGGFAVPNDKPANPYS